MAAGYEASAPALVSVQRFHYISAMANKKATRTQSYHFIWPSWGRDQQWILSQAVGRHRLRLRHAAASCTCRIFFKFRPPAPPASFYFPFAEGKSRSLNLNTDVLIALSPSARTPSAAHKVVTGLRSAECAASNASSQSGNNARYQQPVQICLRHCQTSKQFVPDSANKQTTDGLTDWLTDRVLGK